MQAYGSAATVITEHGSALPKNSMEADLIAGTVAQRSSKAQREPRTNSQWPWLAGGGGVCPQNEAIGEKLIKIRLVVCKADYY